MRCCEELPDLQAVYDQWKDRKDVQLLIVSVDEDFSLASQLAERQHYTFPIIGMPAATVDKLMGIEGVPRVWIVDDTGSVRAAWPRRWLRTGTLSKDRSGRHARGNFPEFGKSLAGMTRNMNSPNRGTVNSTSPCDGL